MSGYFSGRRAAFLAVLGSVSLMAGCHEDDRPLPLEASRQSRYAASSLTYQSTTGEYALRADGDRLLQSVARDLAVALGSDPDLANYIRESIGSSPFEGGALDLAAEIDSGRTGLLVGLSASANLPLSAIRAVLDSLPRLQVHMPVDEHRDRWLASGGEYQVASLFSDDPGFDVHGFDLAGRYVPLDINHPPTVPTLVITPAEINFDRHRASAGTWYNNVVDKYGGGFMSLFGAIVPGLVNSAFASTTARSYPTGGLWMTRSYIMKEDLHEPWPLGPPEIEVFVAKRVGTNLDYIMCSGDNRPFYLDFDQNDHLWSGQVQIAFLFDEDVDYEVHLWEDDHNPCPGEWLEYAPHSNSESAANLISLGTRFFGAIREVLQGNAFTIEAGQGLVVSTVDYLTGAPNSDDYIGHAKKLSTVCYVSSSGPVWHNLEDNAGGYAGYVFLDNTEFADRVLCPQVPPDTLEATIIGPTEVTPWYAEGCEWHASTTGGSGPITSYQWELDGQLVGTDSFLLSPGGLAQGAHWLELMVMDSMFVDQTGIVIDAHNSYMCLSQ